MLKLFYNDCIDDWFGRFFHYKKEDVFKEKMVGNALAYFFEKKPVNGNLIIHFFAFIIYLDPE